VPQYVHYRWWTPSAAISARQSGDSGRIRRGLQRQQVRAILDGWEAPSPERRQVLFRALTNARPSHLLDAKLFDFAGLTLSGATDAPSPGEID